MHSVMRFVALGALAVVFGGPGTGSAHAQTYVDPNTAGRAWSGYTPGTGWTLPPALIHAMGLVKYACGVANRELGKLTASGKNRLDDTQVAAMLQACREVAEGLHDGEFPVDVFQTGSGTARGPAHRLHRPGETVGRENLERLLLVGRRDVEPSALHDLPGAHGDAGVAQERHGALGFTERHA